MEDDYNCDYMLFQNYFDLPCPQKKREGHKLLGFFPWGGGGKNSKVCLVFKTKFEIVRCVKVCIW